MLLATILKQVVMATAYVHSQNMIHRDVKASNILVHGSGRIMLGDFGVSDNMKPGRKKSTFVGSPCWMAPEVIDQTVGYDNTADMWSLGITAIELAEGNPPYHDMQSMKVLLMVLNSKAPRLSKYVGFSQECYDFVTDCLQKDPRQRLQSRDALQKHWKFFKKAQGIEYVYEKILKDQIPLKERIPKRLLKYTEEYFNMRYKLQALKNDIPFEQLSAEEQERRSKRVVKKKVEWIFSGDWTNDTSNMSITMQKEKSPPILQLRPTESSETNEKMMSAIKSGD